MYVLQSNGTFLQCYISKQIDILILTLLSANNGHMVNTHYKYKYLSDYCSMTKPIGNPIENKVFPYIF